MISANRRLKIVHLEDDRMFSELLEMTFDRSGLEVDLLPVDTAATFWAAIEEGGVDLVISDSNLPCCETLTVIKQLRARSIGLPVIFLSGAVPLGGTAAHFEAGATEFLIKDDLPRVVDCVRSLSTGAEPQNRRTKTPVECRTPLAVRSEWASLSRLLIHDLRGPLWRIQGFAELLRDDYGPVLGDGGRSLVNDVLLSAKELKHAVEMIRRLVEVSAAPISLRTFDLSEAANTIASTLSAGAPGRVVEWSVQEGLAVNADVQLMTLALENLLSNAFKFTAEREVARIEVGVRDSAEGRAFFVRDNGVGFDPAEGARLFVPFQRLHPPEGDPGLGIGLALVERIMQRHGGRVWCEGAPNAGATFCFAFS